MWVFVERLEHHGSDYTSEPSRALGYPLFRRNPSQEILALS
ncbi:MULTISPECIES: hypothetical protein [unclassified Peribacillus]|nr:hypothetical protein [Peribacillus sp. Bi96]